MKIIKIVLSEQQQQEIHLEVDYEKVANAEILKYKGKLYRYSAGSVISRCVIFRFIDPEKAVVLE